MYSKELIRGTLKTIIISLLKENGSMYGYELTQTVKSRSGEKILITEGALYPMLHKLEADGVLITESKSIGKRVRKYYRLSEEGQSIAVKMLEEFNEFMVAMNNVIQSPQATTNGLA